MPQTELLPLPITSVIFQMLDQQEIRVELQTSQSSHESVAAWIDRNADSLSAYLCPTNLVREIDSQLNKRWHETKRLVPFTVESLGCQAWLVFRRYALGDWPECHRRHPVDAMRFLQHLIDQEIAPDPLELKRIRRLAG